MALHPELSHKLGQAAGQQIQLLGGLGTRAGATGHFGRHLINGDHVAADVLGHRALFFGGAGVVAVVKSGNIRSAQQNAMFLKMFAKRGEIIFPMGAIDSAVADFFS